MKKQLVRVQRTLAACALTLAFTSPLAHADDVMYGASEAYNLGTDIALLSGILGALGLNPTNLSAGVAPDVYDINNSIADLTISPTILQPGVSVSLTTGLLLSSASSNVDTTPGAKFARASSSTDELDTTVDALLSIVDVLELSASTIRSTAEVTGTPGNFVATGSSYIENLFLDTTLTSPLSVAIYDNLGPNAVLLDLLGITLTLNKQDSFCDAVYCEISVDAIDLSFNNAVFGALTLNGSIKIGHSFAAMSALPVPEPSTYGMMLAGLGLVGFMAVRRRSLA